MRIRSITFKNHKIFGDLVLDLCNKEGNPLENIIFVGENGVGKTKMLNIINSLSDWYLFTIYRADDFSESILFNILLDVEDRLLLKGIDLNIEVDDVIGFTFDIYKNKKINFIFCDGKQYEFDLDQHQELLKINQLFSSVFLNSDEFEQPSDMNLGKSAIFRQDSSWGIKNKFFENLKKLQKKDDLDLAKWCKCNIGQIIDDKNFDVRVGKIKKLIGLFFSNKNIFGFDNQHEHSEGDLYFEEFGKKVAVNDLSSGEIFIILQIMFLLDCDVPQFLLIDEPESGMHPSWQLRIIDFIKSIFTDRKKIVPQMFLATHSPYVIRNFVGEEKDNTSIFIFTKNSEKVNIFNINIFGKGLFPWSPSFGEINFFAYHLPTYEFHDELYGYIQEKTNNFSENKIEEFFLLDSAIQQKFWIKGKKGKAQPPKSVSLMTFIRNFIHHPENQFNVKFTEIELKNSIEYMISIIKNMNFK